MYLLRIVALGRPVSSLLNSSINDFATCWLWDDEYLQLADSEVKINYCPSEVLTVLLQQTCLCHWTNSGVLSLWPTKDLLILVQNAYWLEEWELTDTCLGIRVEMLSLESEVLWDSCSSSILSCRVHTVPCKSPNWTPSPRTSSCKANKKDWLLRWSLKELFQLRHHKCVPRAIFLLKSWWWSSPLWGPVHGFRWDTRPTWRDHSSQDRSIHLVIHVCTLGASNCP